MHIVHAVTAAGTLIENYSVDPVFVQLYSLTGHVPRVSQFFLAAFFKHVLRRSIALIISKSHFNDSYANVN